MANDITSSEYQQYMALREQINEGIENAACVKGSVA